MRDKNGLTAEDRAREERARKLIEFKRNLAREAQEANDSGGDIATGDMPIFAMVGMGFIIGFLFINVLLGWNL